MIKIIKKLKKELRTMQAKNILEFEVLNPDSCTSTYAGNSVTLDGIKYLYRGYSAWVDLAQILHCKMLTPSIVSKFTIVLRFEKLNTDDSFHKTITDKEKKYGSKSIFSEILPFQIKLQYTSD
jgi:hypothetical protein